MSEVAERLRAESLQLSEVERWDLIDALFESMPARTDEAFDELLARRLDDLRSGRDPGVPAEEFMEELRVKHAK